LVVVVVDFEVVLEAEAERAGPTSIERMTSAAKAPDARPKRVEFDDTRLNVTPAFEGESAGPQIRIFDEYWRSLEPIPIVIRGEKCYN
jgi:hypothetical protein